MASDAQWLLLNVVHLAFFVSLSNAKLVFRGGVAYDNGTLHRIAFRYTSFIGQSRIVASIQCPAWGDEIMHMIEISESMETVVK
jgi:hypothetical protein